MGSDFRSNFAKTKAKYLQKVPNDGIKLSVQNYNVSEGSLKLFNAQNHTSIIFFFTNILKPYSHEPNFDALNLTPSEDF